jgi:GT2 family glycosyltransferase/serine/threonine protein kinase
VATFLGYQEFTLTRHTISVSHQDEPLRLKRELLAELFTPAHLTDRTVLDLGANSGFYSFWSLQCGAREAVAVDIDEEYLGNVRSARDHLGFDDLRVVESNVSDWHEAADIVVSLALVHWLYTCTATMGSLAKVVEFLSSLTDYLLIVEWIEPNDPAIEFFNHLDWNPDYVEEPYTLSNFEQALKANFARVEIVGDISPTRKLYAAYRHKNLIDNSNPLPLLFDAGCVISSKLLTTSEGIEYWSRVYRHPVDQTIVKQATLDLASREYFILNEFDSPYFPKALDHKTHEGFSEVTLEYVEGQPVDEIFSEIGQSREEFYRFSRHCLQILSLLQDQAILHRDLYPSNFIIRDGIPVLVDFGWAVSDKYPFWSPPELGYLIRPPDNSFSDVFSLGKLLESVNNKRYSEFSLISDLMTMSNTSLRIEDPKMLIYLLDLVAWKTSKQSGDSMKPTPMSIADKSQYMDGDVFLALLEQLSRRNQQLEAMYDRLALMEKRISEQQDILSDYAATYSGRGKLRKVSANQNDSVNTLQLQTESAITSRIHHHLFRVVRFIYQRYIPGIVKGRIRQFRRRGLKGIFRRNIRQLPTTTSFDVICFATIPWGFRYQRPQQILSQFAQDGHRVIYLNTGFSGVHDPEATIRQIDKLIFEVTLPGESSVNMYRHELADPSFSTADEALETLIAREAVSQALLIVHHPFWEPLAVKLKERYGWKIIYDCMDDHSSFAGTELPIPLLEERLLTHSDLLIVTSEYLKHKFAKQHDNLLLIPNAGDYAHFADLPPRSDSPIADLPSPVIGYYGAIAEWFDAEAISAAARRHPEWSFVLIGHVMGADLLDLPKLPNVHFLGEKPYAELPTYLAAFDICTIPFVITELTKATHPVKLFEYLAAGKPVVSRDLPELGPYSDLVALYSKPDQFVNLLEESLSEDSPDHVASRKEVARQNTWEDRYEKIAQEVEGLYGRASIIVVTFNNLEFTRLGLQSILDKTIYPNYEMIIVDNGSGPELTGYLKQMETEFSDRVKVILNKENLGFAAANNIGIGMAASSEFVVLLNDDVIVTPGWLSALIGHLNDKHIGMVGPVTNTIWNEARIDVTYSQLEDVDAFAYAYTNQHHGETFEIKLLAMYCVAMRKQLTDDVGPLDERYAIGMFEDDDYALRVSELGYRIICARDVFVHHVGAGSFRQIPQEEYMQLFNQNKRRFEEKWNREWEPHQPQ